MAGTVIALVPFVLAISAAVRSGWSPASDQGIELLRMHDVGTGHTPLLGPYSRLGWSHPGPLLFWVSAPFLALFGPAGVLGLVGVLNAGWFVGAVAPARRLGGTALAGAVLVCTALLVKAHGAEKLVDPWNPWVAVLPLLCFLISAAAYAHTRARWTLALAVVAGSLAAQSHLSAVPPVAVATIAAAAWVCRTRTRVDRCRIETRVDRTVDLRALGVAALGAVALWSGPILQQVTATRGNLTDIVAYLIDGGARPAPLGQGLAMAARELGFRPAWTGASELSVLNGAGNPATWTLVVLPVALGLLAVAATRTGAATTARRCGYALALVMAAIVAVSRTTGGLFSYVLRWTWPIAVLATATVVQAVWRLGLDRISRPGTRPTLRRVAAGVALMALVIISATTAADVLRGPVEPLPGASQAAGGTARSIEAALAPGSYRVEWVDSRGFSAAPLGAATTLARHGFDLDFPDREERTVGGFRATGRNDLATLAIVGSTPRPSWDPPPGSRLVARWDPLDPPRRARLEALTARVQVDAGLPADAILLADRPDEAAALVAGGARPADVAALGRLQGVGEAYETWLVPTTP